MIKENTDSHCFESLKSNLNYFFDDSGVILSTIRTSINSEFKFVERIDFSFCDMSSISLIPGQKTNEIILVGFNSYFTIDEKVVDLILMTIFSYVNSCLNYTPKFKLRITQRINSIDSTREHNINVQIKYFKKFGFQILSDSLNSGVIELNWDYSIIEEDILLLLGFPIPYETSMNYKLTG